MGFNPLLAKTVSVQFHTVFKFAYREIMMEVDRAINNLETDIRQNVVNGFSEVVQNINQCLQMMLESVISNAQQVEDSVEKIMNQFRKTSLNPNSAKTSVIKQRQVLDSIHNGSSYQQMGIKDLKKEEIDSSFSTKQKNFQPKRPKVSSQAET